MKAPAGISSASAEAIGRWKLDSHTFQVYNYESHNMIFSVDKNDFRLPSAEECEQLMGIDKYYTMGAVKEKFESRETFVIRRQLLGNSFNCSVVAFLMRELVQNGGFVHEQIPLFCCYQVGASPQPYADVSSDSLPIVSTKAQEKQLIKEYLRISEKGGSDVRLDIGLPYRVGAWPRASARPHLWVWEVVHGYPWRSGNSDHINKLELLAVVNTVQWRLRRRDQQRRRFLHLVDSQVVGAIVSKGRTSSKLLRPAVRKLSCLILAGGLYPLYQFISSEDNPADLPSRYRWLMDKHRKRLMRRLAVKKTVLKKAH